jgi:hypothetical protein
MFPAPPSFLPGSAAPPNPNSLSSLTSSLRQASLGGLETGSSSPNNWVTQMKRWQEEFVGSLSAREFVDGVTAEVGGWRGRRGW